MLTCGGCASFRQALGRDAPPPLGVPAGRPSGEGFIQAHRRYPESRLRRLLGFRHR